jgi:hypothetical protein
VCFLPSWFWDKAGIMINAAFAKFPSLLNGWQRVGTGLINAHPLLFRVPPSRAAQPIGFTAAHLVVAREDRQGAHTSGVRSVAQSPQDRSQSTAGATVKSVRLRASLLTNLLAALFLVYISYWNLQGVTSLDAPEPVENVGAFFGLHQYWSMFAPSPPSVDGWYVIPGTLRSGREVDLVSVTHDDYKMYAVSYEKPQYAADTYETNHWRKYMERVGDNDYPDDLRLLFGDYLCDEWNARHKGSEHLVSFEAIYMIEETLPDNQRDELEKVLLWDQSCS